MQEKKEKDEGAERKDEKNGDKDKEWSNYETVFTNAKAGMDGVDKEKVKKVVYEMSKGSAFFANEQRKDSAVQEKLERLKIQAAKVTEEQLAAYQKVADRHVVELEASRDLNHVWMHVDMDAFYAAVETLERPSLANVPMAVGSIGMLCTANYEARKYGARAAMPGFIARKLCPKLVIIKPDFEKYSKYSELTREVFREYDPHFVARSMDEAYLNITRVCQERGLSSAEVADEIRSKVKERTKLTCSAGIAANRLLAKVCSDINKPDGQYVLPNEQKEIMDFISSLPIRKTRVFVGWISLRRTDWRHRQSERKAPERGFGSDYLWTATGEKGSFICPLLQDFYRHSQGPGPQGTGLNLCLPLNFFIAVGMGVGGSLEPEVEGRKSLSCERTFHAISHPVDLNKKLEELAESLAKEMAEEGLMGKTLTLKLKTTAFEVRTRAVTLPKYIASRDEILSTAIKLLQVELPISIRLMGLRLSNFKGEKAIPSDPHQQTLNSFFTLSNNTAINDNNRQCPQEPMRWMNQNPISCPVSHLEETTSQESGLSKYLFCENTCENSHLDSTAFVHGFHSNQFSNSSETKRRRSENDEGNDYCTEILRQSSMKWRETANIEDPCFQKDGFSSRQEGYWDPGEEFADVCKEQWNYNGNEGEFTTYPSPFGPRDCYFERESLDGGETTSFDNDRVNTLMSESMQMGGHKAESTGATDMNVVEDRGERREGREKMREGGNRREERSSQEERGKRELRRGNEHVNVDGSLETKTDGRFAQDSENLVTARGPEGCPKKSLFQYYEECDNHRYYFHKDNSDSNGIDRQTQGEVNPPTTGEHGVESLSFSGCGKESLTADASIRDGHKSCHSGWLDIDTQENRLTKELVKKVEWTETNEGYFLCNLCGEKLKADDFFMVEHEDFHLAQMLQEREMRGSSSHPPSLSPKPTPLIQGTHSGAQRGSRNSRTPPRANSRKARATGISTGRQKRSKLLTMDAFLTKTGTS